LNALNLLKSLKNNILKIRNSSEIYENKVIELGPEINSLYHDEGRRTKK
jgi:hypothetical protein